MPKHFMVRKKSTSQKSWKGADNNVDVTDDKETPPEPVHEDLDARVSPLKPQDEPEDTDEPEPKRMCRPEERRLLTRPAPIPLLPLSPPDQPYSPLHVHYKSPHEIFRRDCFEFPPFSNVPMFPRFPTPLMWNPVLHTHAHSSPFMHVHSPPKWLPTSPPVPPTSSPLQTTWRTSPVVKTPSPVGVLAPSEIPSPNSLTVAEEPSSSNSASIPGVPTPKIDYSRCSDQSKVLLHVPPSCYSPREPASPFPKPTGLKVEVINNGFGIKNPMLTNEVPRQTELPGQPSGYLMTSEISHCSLCGFKTDSPRQLQKHLRSHKEIKRFLCTVCGKGFNDTFDLKRHTRTHTGVRPYKCDKCGKAFTQRCSLESHCKKIHGDKFAFGFNERRTKTYVCEECGHSTNDPEEHFVHLRTQHPNNPALLRCHDRRQFKFMRRKNSSGS